MEDGSISKKGAESENQNSSDEEDVEDPWAARTKEIQFAQEDDELASKKEDSKVQDNYFITSLLINKGMNFSSNAGMTLYICETNH